MKFSEFIYNFIKRKGLQIAFSSILEKIGGFCLVFIATNLLTKNEFGFITYANTIVVFIIPFIGFGLHQGLIRYGSISSSQIEKKKLFLFTLKKGLIFSILLTILLIIFSPIITANLKKSLIYLCLLSFQLVSLFFYEMLRIYSRLLHLNKLYAQITIVKTITIVGVAFLFTYNFNSIGYVLAIAFVPFLVSLFYLRKLKLLNFLSTKIVMSIKYRELFSYGLYSSLGGVLSQLLYAVDIILIGNLLMDETNIAWYKVSSILPFSLLILPLIFMNTDFVKIANKSVSDKKYIKIYYINYLKLFFVVSFLVFLLFYFFSDFLITLFGPNYSDTSIMMIFTLGVIGALLVRIPLGNILSAIGLARVNAINSFIVLILNCILSYIFILKRGVGGAAIVTASLMWFSGFLSLYFFINFLRKK